MSENMCIKLEDRFDIDKDTIIDKQTGLIWERDMGKRGSMTWNEAMKINDNGFKLPTRKEFSTLALYREEFTKLILSIERYSLKNELELIAFENVNNIYWTSDEDKFDTAHACFVHLGYADSGGIDKTYNFYAVCVRRNS